jgi:hypothetical protein
MTAIRANPRLQVGSASWIAEERASALQIAEAEAEEFTFSARNEIDWLNEHMAEIFSKNQVFVNNLSITDNTDFWVIEMLRKSSKHRANYVEKHQGRLERTML